MCMILCVSRKCCGPLESCIWLRRGACFQVVHLLRAPDPIFSQFGQHRNFCSNCLPTGNGICTIYITCQAAHPTTSLSFVLHPQPQWQTPCGIYPAAAECLERQSAVSAMNFAIFLSHLTTSGSAPSKCQRSNRSLWIAAGRCRRLDRNFGRQVGTSQSLQKVTTKITKSQTRIFVSVFAKVVVSSARNASFTMPSKYVPKNDPNNVRGLCFPLQSQR